MRSFSKWPLRTASQSTGALPDALVTVSIGFSAGDMPPAVALLLPNASGAQDLLDDLGDVRPSGLGLFLADPNLLEPRLSRQIARGTDWVCNFPSVGQHEQEFRRYLAEVDLDHPREMRILSDLAAAGLSCIATVSAERDVAGALAARPAALLVVPAVPEFTGGEASLDRRIALERAITGRSEGVPVIGLRGRDEDDSGLAASLLAPCDVIR
jgi:hypothetical protein